MKFLQRDIGLWSKRERTGWRGGEILRFLLEGSKKGGGEIGWTARDLDSDRGRRIPKYVRGEIVDKRILCLLCPLPFWCLTPENYQTSIPQ